MVSAPAVSVLIPSYNSAAFLADALHSVQDQSHADFECIIIDDASTDTSLAIAERFASSDPRFKLVRLQRNQGASAARNVGLGTAIGQWITLLDADDLYVADRLDRLTRICHDWSADLVIDDQMVTEFPATRSAQRAFGFRGAQSPFSQEDFFSGSRLFRGTLSTGYMKPLMRRDFLRQAGALYDPSVVSGEDFLFYARLFAMRPCCVATGYCGYIYRRRRGSLSRSDDHLHVHAQLGERLMSEFGDQLSPRSRAALAARSRDFQQVASAAPALKALRRRDFLRLAATLIKRPSIALTGVRMLRTRLVRSWSALRAPAFRRSG